VSRQAKELLIALLLVMMVVATLMAVEVNTSICYSLLKSGFFTWILASKFGI